MNDRGANGILGYLGDGMDTGWPKVIPNQKAR